MFENVESPPLPRALLAMEIVVYSYNGSYNGVRRFFRGVGGFFNPPRPVNWDAAPKITVRGRCGPGSFSLCIANIQNSISLIWLPAGKGERTGGGGVEM